MCESMQIHCSICPIEQVKYQGGISKVTVKRFRLLQPYTLVSSVAFLSSAYNSNESELSSFAKLVSPF